MAPIHDRMAPIVPASACDVWLDPAIDDPRRVRPLLAPYPAQEMEAYPTSRLVNSPRNDAVVWIRRMA